MRKGSLIAMPILELDSEAAQLRQVARSFAEGDLEFEDYRQIRTAVIDGFAERFARPNWSHAGSVLRSCRCTATRTGRKWRPGTGCPAPINPP